MYSPSFIIFFLLYIFTPVITEQPSIHNHSALKGEFSEPSSPSSSNHELDPDFIAMVWKRPFSGEINEDTYEYLQEFEELCSDLVILGMTQEAFAVEIVSLLSYREGKAMVHPHDRKYER